MGEIISVISAKGGAGKTSIAVSLAHASACYGLKTLVVDCDLHTNGATIFYNLYRKGTLLNDNPVTFQKILQSSISRADGSGISGEMLNHPVVIEENLDFIPAGKYPVLDLDRIVYGEYEKLAAGFEAVVSFWDKRYDVVILDQASGINSLNNIMVIVSAKVLLVRENDRLGLEAARELYNYLSGRNRQIIFCTNKIPEKDYPDLSEKEEDDDIIIKCVGFKYDLNLMRRMEQGKMTDPIPYKVARRVQEWQGYALEKMSRKLLGQYSSQMDEYLVRKQAEDDAYVEEEKRKHRLIKKKVIILLEISVLAALALGTSLSGGLYYAKIAAFGGSVAWGVFVGIVMLTFEMIMIFRKAEYKSILEEIKGFFTAV